MWNLLTLANGHSLSYWDVIDFIGSERERERESRQEFDLLTYIDTI